MCSKLFFLRDVLKLLPFFLSFGIYLTLCLHLVVYSYFVYFTFGSYNIPVTIFYVHPLNIYFCSTSNQYVIVSSTDTMWPQLLLEMLPEVDT